MKCIDDEIPFEVPESWEWVRLSHLASFAGGKTPSTENASFWGGDILWVTSKDMKTHNIYDTQIKLSSGGAAQMQVFPVETILLVVRSGILRRTLPIAILKKEATVNQDIKAVTLFLSWMSEFTRFSLMALENVILSNFTKAGTTVESINFDKLKDILLPIPPQSEQILITHEIERYNSFIEELEENKEELEQVVKQTKSKILDLAIRGKLVPQNPNDEPASVLLERIKSEYPESKKKTQKTRDNSHYTDSIEIPDNWSVTSMQDICYLSDAKKVNSKELPYLDVKYLRGKSDANTLLSGKFVKKNTFLILVDGENSGEIFLTKEDGYQGSTFKILNISDYMDENFVFKLLQNEQVAFKESKVGSAIPHLNKKLFRELPVLLPPLTEQKRIVQKIDEIFSFLDGITDSIKA